MCFWWAGLIWLIVKHYLASNNSEFWKQAYNTPRVQTLRLNPFTMNSFSGTRVVSAMPRSDSAWKLRAGLVSQPGSTKVLHNFSEPGRSALVCRPLSNISWESIRWTSLSHWLCWQNQLSYVFYQVLNWHWKTKKNDNTICHKSTWSEVPLRPKSCLWGRCIGRIWAGPVIPTSLTVM